MPKAIIEKWKDGDSGTMIMGNGIRKRFRLSNVNSPERSNPGFGASSTRTKNIVHDGDSVSIKIVGKDAYGRDIIEMNKNGKNVNNVLEHYNKIYYG